MAKKPSSTTRRTLAGALAALTLAAGAVGCGSSDSGDGGGGTGSDTFNYLVLLPLSGNLSSIGAADRAAVAASVDQVNSEGGILGKQVAATYIDSTGTSSQAVAALQKELTSGKKYDYVLNGATSTEAVPTLPFLTQSKVVSCTSASATALNDPAQFPYHFITSAISDRNAEALASALQEKGYKNVAGMFPDTELGHSNRDAAVKASGALGITMTTVDADPAALDLSPQMTQLQGDDPDALVLDGFGPIAGVMLKSRTKIGWDVPVMGNDTFGVNNFSQLADPGDFEGVDLNTQLLNVTDTAVTKSAEFKTYADALAKQTTDLTFAAEVYGDNYSCLLLGRAGAEKAGSTDADTFKAGMEQLQTAADVKGWFVSKDIKFSATNHAPVYSPEDSAIFEAGERVNGLMVPGSFGK
ncbi:ABC transporter substrate-binding protein [Nakamurella alba]|nr:ABC transporter substrate-binding protein [Nakamurella alba]